MSWFTVLKVSGITDLSLTYFFTAIEIHYIIVLKQFGYKQIWNHSWNTRQPKIFVIALSLHICYITSSKSCHSANEISHLGAYLGARYNNTWVLRRLKSPTTLMFVRQLDRGNSTGNTKAMHYYPLWGEQTGGIPSQRTSNAESTFMPWRLNAYLDSLFRLVPLPVTSKHGEPI